ncbi:MAG: AMP-binding protein [Salinirussus sp.]
MATDIAWEPYGYYRTKSNVARFMDQYGYEAYEDLLPETEDELAEFWAAAAEDVGVVWDTPYETVLDTSDGYAFADWFVEGELNAVETVLDQWVDRTPDRLAYVWEGEEGATLEYTYAELDREVNRIANALREQGIGKGDTVGLIFPLHPDAIVASLACMKIGAVQTQIFAGYGATAIAQRLDDADAELVILADGYRRMGDEHDLLEKFADVIPKTPNLETVVTYDRIGSDRTLSGIDTISWTEFRAEQPETADTTIVDVEHPAFIAYSSGTTGKPKGTIHTHTAMLVDGMREMKYHFDVSEGDVFTWVTDFGWVVVPAWLMTASGLGSTVALVGGAPNHPDGERLWRLVEEFGITTLGISPTGARGMRNENETPREDNDLSSLRILGSTGEPWDRETWQWYFENVGGGHLPIINDSGGTELCGGILAPSPLTPLKPGTLWGSQIGVSVDVYDEAGTPSDEGYLVCDLPKPGMTHSLTGGDDRYLDEYWSDFEGVWNQNDWVEVDEDGHWYITGRADDTMNVSGRRITAPELEEAILATTGVGDAAVIDIEDDSGNTVPVAFVTVTDEAPTDVEAAVQETVAERLGAPFRPAAVHVVDILPRTQTGKLPRGRFKDVYLTGSAGDTSTLDNPDALDAFPQRN